MNTGDSCKPDPPGGFPYALLVRAPLAVLLPLFLLLLYARFGPTDMFSPSPPWLEVGIGSIFALLLAVALLQLYAIPRGFWILARASTRASLVHQLALLCGVLHLSLAAFLVSQTLYVY